MDSTNAYVGFINFETLQKFNDDYYYDYFFTSLCLIYSLG